MNKIQIGKDIKITQIGNDYQMSGLLFTGADRSFILQLPHKAGDIHTQLDLLELDDEGLIGFMRQLDVLETEIITSGPGGMMKSIVRKTQRQIDNIIQWQVFERDNYTCQYCGRRGIPMSVDHIVVWEEGGATIIDNLLCTCKKCNRDRGNMAFDKWLESPYFARVSKNLSTAQVNRLKMIALDLPRLESLKVMHMRSR